MLAFMRKPDKDPHPSKRAPRLQAPPPALLGSGEPFVGFDILEEWKDEKALVFWNVLRDCLLWASVPAEKRKILFSQHANEQRAKELSQCSLISVVIRSLKILSEVLQSESGTGEEQLATACRCVAEWADENSYPRTAISFAQAAAVIQPDNPTHAYTVGLLCRRNSEYNRAETWFRRTRVLSWRANDPQSHALSWVGLGNVFIQRGEFTVARQAHLRALRIAQRRGYWVIKGMALHDLFTIAVEQRNTPEAERLAHQAARAYSSSHPKFPALAHDIATFWMYQGFFRRALTVFQAVVKLITRPDERLVALSMVCRAAAGVGDLKLFTETWIAVNMAVSRNPTTDRACAALLNLAYGAAILKDWIRAELAAQHALELSAKRGEAEVYACAEQLLVSVKEKSSPPTLIQPPAESEILEAADTLARHLVRRLTTRAR